MQYHRFKGNQFYILFSALFALMILFSGKITASQDLSAKFGEVLFRDFTAADLPRYLMYALVTYIAVCALRSGAAQIAERREHGTFVRAGAAGAAKEKGEDGNGARRTLCLSFAGLLLVWLPYLLSFMPGGVFSDTGGIIQQALGNEPLSSHHPVLYTMMIRAVLWLSGRFGLDAQAGLCVFTILQYLCMAFVCALIVTEADQLMQKRLFTVLCWLYMALFTLIPLNTVSLWKDTVFTMAVVLYTLCIAQYLTKNRWSWEAYIVSSVLVAFLRNNGIYMIAICSLCLAVRRWTQNRREGIRTGIVSIVMIALISLVQGPGFEALGIISDREIESFAVPIQQYAYTVLSGGSIPEEDRDFWNKLIPEDKIYEAYSPELFDTMKTNENFNRALVENKSGEILAKWAKVVARNPVSAVKGYALETIGFWDVTRQNSFSYESSTMYSDKDGWTQTDYWEKITGTSFASLVKPKHYVSSAVFVWIMLLCMAASLTKKDHLWMAMMPGFMLWATTMAATPVAFSMRYIFALVVLVPVYIACAVRRQTAAD